MSEPDDFDSYFGQFDDEVAAAEERVEEMRAKALPPIAFNGPPNYETLPKTRPWWCARCGAGPTSEEETKFGFCTVCSKREQAQKERARAASERHEHTKPTRRRAS